MDKRESCQGVEQKLVVFVTYNNSFRRRLLRHGVYALSKAYYFARRNHLARPLPTADPTKLSPTMAPALPDKPSIAVLPFENLSDDREQECFADGMVEEIITALSRIRWLFVIARNSSFTYKGYDLGIEHVEKSIRLNPRERSRIGSNLILGIGHFFAPRGEKAGEMLGIALQEK